MARFAYIVFAAMLTSACATDARRAGDPAQPLTYYAKVQRDIAARTRYPASAFREQEEGQCVVAAMVLRSGEITESELVTPSGFADIDTECLRVVEPSTRTLPFPDTVPEGVTSSHIQIPLVFRLP